MSWEFFLISFIVRIVLMIFRRKNIVLFIILVSVLIVPVSAVSVIDSQSSVISLTTSDAFITFDTAVSTLGYFVNEKPKVTQIPVSTSGDTIFIRLSSLPSGMQLKTVVDDGKVRELIGHPVTITVEPHTEPMSIKIHLSLIEDPNAPPKYPFPGFIPGIIPDEPENPDTPSDPEHPDTPGSDEPLVPILPPADSVYNFAGFIPLLAGFFLLFLLVAFRGNLVYRILKKHAKRHGEKPDKEEKKQLKATASAIILLIRDEERYGEWKKNREMEMRLSADIISVLDETQYPPQIPRGAVAAEILKAAKGRINRHRL